MAARRMLKNWTESGKVDTLSAAGERFFTRLIMVADDYGSFPENLTLLKSKCFPLKKDVKEVKIGEWVDELITADVVFRYEVGGSTYIRIRDFDQRVQSKRNIYPHPTQTNGEAPKKTVTHGEQAPEEKEKRSRTEEEVEDEANALAWFQGLFDERFLETLQMTHRDKDVPQAIKEAFLHARASPTRWASMDGPAAKRLVNTWLANMKSKKPGNEGRKPRDFGNL